MTIRTINYVLWEVELNQGFGSALVEVSQTWKPTANLATNVRTFNQQLYL